jgi:quercetin dioxygenase-like cupin family protein
VSRPTPLSPHDQIEAQTRENTSQILSSIRMPMKIVRNSRAAGKDSIKFGPTFTGDVWADPVITEEGFAILNVMFTPCARTHWHTHEGGQLLIVKAGSGWVCDKGGEPQRINVGDVIWCPPGTTHWHGGDKGSYMLHTAITHGAMTWHEPVSEEEYNKAAK